MRAHTIFRSGEISAKQNFNSAEGKFRQQSSEIYVIQRKFAGDLTKFVANFRQIFQKTKDEIRQTLLSLIFYSFAHDNNLRTIADGTFRRFGGFGTM